MAASLFGYALQGPPPKNRWRWLMWVVAVLAVVLGVGVPTAIGAILQWMAVDAGDGDAASAVGLTVIAAFMFFLLIVVAVAIPGQWRFHRERDAAASAGSVDQG
jgi:formate hydrogenlyase subunit 3/multisubunit Na+/H+ antiporter MnhD subunit